MLDVVAILWGVGAGFLIVNTLDIFVKSEDLKLLILMGIAGLIIIFLTLNASADCVPTKANNIRNLNAVTEVVGNGEDKKSVRLRADMPWILVTKEEKRYYDENGRLPMDGGRLP